MSYLNLAGAVLRSVQPVLDEQGAITELRIDLGLSYMGADGYQLDRVVSVNVWDILSDAQKAAMNDIQGAITQYVQSTYS